MTSRRPGLRTSIRAGLLPYPPADVWAVVASGEDRRQWYVDALPWLVRGGLDRAMGGAGRRWPPPGRPLLRVGDTAGFWRVIECGEGRLVLRAEVRAPGLVLLHVRVTPVEPGSHVETRIELRPRGVLGAAYLLADLPAREIVTTLAHRAVESAVTDVLSRR